MSYFAAHIEEIYNV